MINEASNGLVDISGLGTLNVFVETVIGVGASHIVQVGVNEACSTRFWMSSILAGPV